MRRFSLEEWALIAQVIGGFAVVITLGFLALETRDNTNAIQAQTYQALTSDLNRNRALTTEPSHLEIYLRYRKGGLAALTEQERFYLMLRSEAHWGIYESAYFAWQRGALGEPEWVRFVQAICRNHAREADLWRGVEGLAGIEGLSLATNITPRFREFVETTCPPLP